MSDQLARVAIFQKQKIRKQLHNSEWWLVISDVVAALTNSTDPARYLRNLRARERLERETGRGVVRKSNFLAKGHKGGEV